MALNLCSECSKDVSDKAAACPHCGAPVSQGAESDETKADFAVKRRKSEFVGVGALIQLIAIVLLFFFPIGTILGVVLFFVGSAKSMKLLCSLCGNKVSKEASICPHCRATFARKSGWLK